MYISNTSYMVLEDELHMRGSSGTFSDIYIMYDRIQMENIIEQVLVNHHYFIKQEQRKNNHRYLDYFHVYTMDERGAASIADEDFIDNEITNSKDKTWKVEKGIPSVFIIHVINAWIIVRVDEEFELRATVEVKIPIYTCLIFAHAKDSYLTDKGFGFSYTNNDGTFIELSHNFETNRVRIAMESDQFKGDLRCVDCGENLTEYDYRKCDRCQVFYCMDCKHESSKKRRKTDIGDMVQAWNCAKCSK